MKRYQEEETRTQKGKQQIIEQVSRDQKSYETPKVTVLGDVTELTKFFQVSVIV